MVTENTEAIGEVLFGLTTMEGGTVLWTVINSGSKNSEAEWLYVLTQKCSSKHLSDTGHVHYQSLLSRLESVYACVRVCVFIQQCFIRCTKRMWMLKKCELLNSMNLIFLNLNWMLFFSIQKKPNRNADVRFSLWTKIEETGVCGVHRRPLFPSGLSSC